MTNQTQNDSKTMGSGASPLPPRRRWLKRIALILLVLIVLAGGVRAWWGHYANERVAAFLAQAKLNGEPSSPTDFQTPSIPEEQNAAVLIAQSGQLFHLTNDQRQFLRNVGLWLDVSPGDQPAWNEVLADIGPSLRLVRLSRSRPLFHSIHTIDQDVWDESHHDANLADILARLASQEWEAGDLDASIDHVLDIIQIARAMRSDAQVYHMFWESLNAEASSLQAALQFAEPTKVQLDQIARNPDHYRQRMRNLIALLFDEARLRQAMQTNCYSEGLRAIREARFNAGSIESQWVLDRTLQPSLRIQAIRSARRYFALARLGNQPTITFDSALAALPPRDEKKGPNVRLWLITDARTGADPEAMLATYCRYLAYYRDGAIVMAIHLYAIDHKGVLPAKLDDLVPTYLPAIPRCPVGSADQRFVYEANGTDRASVYCPVCRIFVGNWQRK